MSPPIHGQLSEVTREKLAAHYGSANEMALMQVRA